ncbi:MAG: hypothetical protein PHE88_02795 [Elusimicrobia bacterium]|nr:hypothetical protein [Elusimicrobiota bacterium]
MGLCDRESGDPPLKLWRAGTILIVLTKNVELLKYIYERIAKSIALNIKLKNKKAGRRKNRNRYCVPGFGLKNH